MEKEIKKPTLAEFAKRLRQAGFDWKTGPNVILREMVIAEMHERRGNQCEVAKALGIHRNTLSRYLAQEKIPSRPENWRPAKRRPEAYVPFEQESAA